MVTLTDAERDELHHAVLRDVIAAGETVPNVHATAETIVAAHVQAERDRLLARIEALAEQWETERITGECGHHAGMRCACPLTDDQSDGDLAVADLSALLAEERGR